MNPSVTIAAITQAGGVIISLLGLIGTLVGVLVAVGRSRRSADAARDAADTAVHELRPNSGSTLRDAVNRLERAVAAVAKDVGGIREENRDDRRATETRLAGLEKRIQSFEEHKEPHV